MSATSTPRNEPVFEYAPGSQERAALAEALKHQSATPIEVAPIIGGKTVQTGKTGALRAPHCHALNLGKCHFADGKMIEEAIQSALQIAPGWASTSWKERASIFTRAADLLATKYRYVLNAATMLGQSKTCHQAEIDSACELTDFLRFNVHFAETIFDIQPISGPGQKNYIDYRPLEGFVVAVTPFNFTAIAGNLPTAAAMMGNVVLWKPATTALVSAYHWTKILEEAGLPPGVIQFLPSSGAEFGSITLKHPQLAGIHFTGSSGVFQDMWKTVGENIRAYRSYPRIVGETGGKDFIFAHPSANPDVLVAAIVRGAYEYQGQKCSAASRAYIPKALWNKIREPLLSEIKTIQVGDVADFQSFMGAVIDAKSYANIQGYLDEARNNPDLQILAGGKGSDKEGYFIEPTLLETKNPKTRIMCEEIFGPVLTVYVYDEKDMEETLTLCDSTSPYALTGAVLAEDRKAIEHILTRLRQSAGNFYINNKPTGAVVGQQPFGGARASGTNDKAGSLFNLIRWTSLRTVSETLSPPTDYRYPFLQK